MFSYFRVSLLFFYVLGGQVQCQSTTSAAQQFLQPDTAVVNTATATLIGVATELHALNAVQKPAPTDAAEQWRSLALHERVYERVTMVQLQVDATTASIDNEIARSTEVRGYLSNRRDRNVNRANLFSALFGGGLSGVSAGLQLSSKQTNAEAATGMTGGAIATGLAVYGIHAQRGATRELDAESNMLAEFFGRPELSTSHYPPVVWDFLGEVAPTDPDHLMRRERLLRTWLELNRLDSLSSDAGKVKVKRITSMPDQHLQQTIDDLEDRIAMLQDVRAKLSFLKRDLASLLASLPAIIMPDSAAATRP